MGTILDDLEIDCGAPEALTVPSAKDRIRWNSKAQAQGRRERPRDISVGRARRLATGSESRRVIE